MQPVTQNPVIQNTFLGSKYFNPAYLFNQEITFYHNVVGFFTPGVIATIISVFHIVLTFLAIFFITIILYSIVRLFEIRKKEQAHLHHEIAEYAHNQAEEAERLKEDVGGSKNERWSQTLNYLFSQHASDWKLAIIEADSMLESLMETLGFHGESLGDKLKMANQDNFPQLTSAWEVHTIRNRIAHEGLAFELSQHEAKRVIAIYEHIFHAYGFI